MKKTFILLLFFCGQLNSQSLLPPESKLNSQKTATFSGISGMFYKDLNGNCFLDGGDSYITNVPVKLYNSSGSLVAQFFSSQSPNYSFNNLVNDIYSVKIDTFNIPYVSQCIMPGIDSTNLIYNGNPIGNINFNFACKSGFDIGCNGHWLTGSVFPGVNHQMYLNIGNLNSNCITATGGQVIVSISGPATIAGPVVGSYTPIISGNTCTYTIPSFSNVSYTDFFLSVTTLTSAIIGNSICVNVTVTPTLGDFNIGNNNYTFYHPVGNSYDPNQKQTYPKDVFVGYQDWFIYTINFQNLGNAAANNIKILDTLDANIDLRTFQIVGNSDPFNVTIDNNIANFNFPFIFLPDSTSDPEGSKGFIQYRVKPKPGLQSGTKIKNRAHIYFDFNPAVVTNQTINNFISTIGLKEINNFGIPSIFPNPAKSKLNITFEKYGFRKISIKDILGKEVFYEEVNAKENQIDIFEIQNGIYFLEILEENNLSVHKIVIDK